MMSVAPIIMLNVLWLMTAACAFMAGYYRGKLSGYQEARKLLQEDYWEGEEPKVSEPVLYPAQIPGICSECAHLQRCKWLVGAKPWWAECDFWPRRFLQKPRRNLTPRAAKAESVADIALDQPNSELRAADLCSGRAVSESGSGARTLGVFL